MTDRSTQCALHTQVCYPPNCPHKQAQIYFVLFFFCTVRCDTIMLREPTKCALFLINVSIQFLVSSIHISNIMCSVIRQTICIIYIMYLLTAIGFPPGGSSTVHIYTQTIHRTTQRNNIQNRTYITIRIHKRGNICRLIWYVFPCWSYYERLYKIHNYRTLSI